jgi:hypothetical protein
MKRSWMVTMAMGLTALLSVTVATHASGTTESSNTTAVESTKTAKVQTLDLRFEYPATWTVFTFDPNADAKTRKALAKANPKMADAFDSESATNVAKGYKFSAQDFDAKFRGDYASAVSVSQFVGFPTSLKAFDDSIRSQLEQAGATVFSTSVVRVSGEKSWRADVRIPVNIPNAAPVTVRVSMLAVPRGMATALVAVATSDDDAGNALIDSILRSVRRI